MPAPIWVLMLMRREHDAIQQSIPLKKNCIIHWCITYIHNFYLLSSLLIRRMIESDKDYLVLLGQNIAKRRKILMMTQADLAYRIGMEVPNLSVIENGKSNPQLLTLLKISGALKCELSEIIPPIGNPDQVFEMRPQYIPRKHKGLED